MNNLRFSGADWLPKEREDVLIIGAGGIGSWVAFFISRIGYHSTIYDFDHVEAHNMGGQLYSHDQLFMNKGKAIYDTVNKFTGSSLISLMDEKYDQNSMDCKYTIVCVDNMTARNDAFIVWKRKVLTCGLTDAIFIDGRLEMEQLQIFTVTPSNIEEYEKSLFEDLEVEDNACSLQQTSHVAAMIGGLITSLFTNYMANVYTREQIRSIPFYTDFFIPSMTFNCTNDYYE